MEDPGLLAGFIKRVASEFALMKPMIPTYVHLLASALFPIYAGAHASLSRPTSAAKRQKKDTTSVDEDESSDEEDEEEYKMEGLSPSDAIIMPLFAGATLAGLYFLIKWLKDPAILNKLLNAYFALFGVFSVARLITDSLDIGHSIIFPRRYALAGALYHVHGKEKKAVPVAGDTKGKQAISTPLPGFLALVPLPRGLTELLWADRAMPGKKWTVRMYLHRIFAAKLGVGPHGFTGFALATAAVIYFNLVDKPWYLTNLMGFGFSYGALQLMSPTTFATGSLILGALFFYDIYFVFFTPMMVTVAKSLDVPIKLVFPRPAPPDSTSALPSHAMLGLGDVVFPGIMIGLALRFDLFLFYLRRQKHKPSPEKEGKVIVEKPKYFSLAGRWSDHFWTHSLFGRPLFSTPEDKPEPPFTFPKTYFKASIVGYVVGMLATLGVMHVWGHAQPALLYLVPTVLGSLWLTAWVKGELSLMWNFSEAIEEEVEDGPTDDNTKTSNQSASSGRTSFFSLSDKKAREREARIKKSMSKHITADSPSDMDDDPKNENSKTDRRVKEVAEHRSEREVFSISIEAPWKLKHPRSIRQRRGSTEGEKKEEASEQRGQSPRGKGKAHCSPPTPTVEENALQPPEKRLRVT